jgi:hypothetical protein
MAPSFYRTLAFASPARFRLVTFSSFGIVFLISLLHALPGFFTFGRSCQPLLLNNYHPTEDRPATAARAATAASLICSFPFVFMGLREAVLPTLAPWVARLHSSTTMPSFTLGLKTGLTPGLPPSAAHWLLTSLLIGSPIVSTALLASNLGLVVGLMGSILGGALMYLAPAAMHAACLLGPLNIAGGGGVQWISAAAAAARALPPGRRLALAADVGLILYGLVGQMVVGTAIIYKYAQEKEVPPPNVT